jgi:ribonucleoside-diphosphate reductase alpha chain
MAEATNSATSAAAHGWATHYSQSATGVNCTRFFSKPGISPYSEVIWERRTASITDAGGATIFEQKDVEVPADWSMTATNIVASKYLHGHLGIPQGEFGARETGVR